MDLNASQREAVSFRDGPCMVLAGPGSGKTTVIARRAVTLVREYKVPEETILVVTFTKAAAEEMKKRYLSFSGQTGTRISFGTFHAVFYGILREEYRLSSHAVIGEGEKARIMEEAVREVAPSVETDREFIASVLSAVSLVKNHRLDPDRYDAGFRQFSFGRVYRVYQQKLKQRNVLDFDDMLTMTSELFRKKPEVLERWRKKYRYFLVDEFQDVNPVQYEVVQALAAPENNLFIVGDDDQSIYGFRGARPEVMLNFPKTYPEAKKILLGVNYRSGSEIVKRSLALIGHNEDRFKKKLTAAKAGGTVKIREFLTDALEYEAIGSEIVGLMNEGRSPSEMAILFRTNAGMSGMLQKLMEKSVPFVTRDRVPNVFAHFVCRPLFACLNFLAGNRTRRNFFQFMNCPWRYFKREDFPEETVDLEALAKRFEATEDRGFMAGKTRSFAGQLSFMASLKVPFAMIHYFRNYLGYDRYLSEAAVRRNLNEEELIRVLDEVQASARGYDSPEAWYGYVAKYSRELKEKAEREEEEKKERKDAVTVSTMHSAKGLEYPFVWIADVNERVIPHEKSKTPQEIEEERSVLYVGMTRAAEALCLYEAKNRFGRDMQPSRFLKEI